MPEFRPDDKKGAYWALVNVLAEPTPAHQGLSEPEQAILPARKETD